MLSVSPTLVEILDPKTVRQKVRSKVVRGQVRERTPEKQFTDDDIVDVRSKVVRSQVRTADSDSEIVEVRSQVRTATSEKEIIETAAHYRDVEMFSNHVEFSLVEYEDAEAFGTEGKFYLSECAAKVYGKTPNDVLKKIRKLEKAYVSVFGLKGNFSLNECLAPQNGEGEKLKKDVSTGAWTVKFLRTQV